jgi:hypothetical protein
MNVNYVTPIYCVIPGQVLRETAAPKQTIVRKTGLSAEYQTRNIPNTRQCLDVTDVLAVYLTVIYLVLTDTEFPRLELSVFNYALQRENIRTSGGVAPRILKLGIK